MASLEQQALDAWHAFKYTTHAPGSQEAWRLHDELVAANARRDAARSSSQPQAAAPSGPLPPPPPPPKPPDPWIRTSTYVAPKGVKQADPDVVLFNEEAVSPERLIELQYEDISGTELINISRSDIVDGIDVAYSPVKNFSGLRRKYNPNNIIALPANSSSYFSKFAINLILRGIYEPYFDAAGNLVIEIDNVLENEIVEVEVDTGGTINLVEFQ